MTTASAIILQARMASTRLPGQGAGADLVDGRSSRDVSNGCRVRASLPVILATTTRADDDVLAEEGRRLGIPVFRGSDDDVLGALRRRW